METVADLWALERSGAIRARYHVLGGTLSPLDGIGPQDLTIDALITRAHDPAIKEVILALNATIVTNKRQIAADDFVERDLVALQRMLRRRQISSVRFSVVGITVSNGGTSKFKWRWSIGSTTSRIMISFSSFKS